MASTEAPPTSEGVMESATLEVVSRTDALNDWVAAQVKAEVARVASMGSKCVPVPVAVWGTDVEGEEGTVVHVLQAATKCEHFRSIPRSLHASFHPPCFADSTSDVFLRSC